MAASISLRLHRFSNFLWPTRILKNRQSTISVTRLLSTVAEREHSENGHHINAAAFEKGSTMYFCNRNPRSLELLGMAEKPKGFITKNQRVDYYHRCVYVVS